MDDDNKVRLNFYINDNDDHDLFEYFISSGNYELSKHARKLLRIGLTYMNNNQRPYSHDNTNESCDATKTNKRYDKSCIGNLSDIIDDSDIKL